MSVLELDLDPELHIPLMQGPLRSVGNTRSSASHYKVLRHPPLNLKPLPAVRHIWAPLLLLSTLKEDLLQPLRFLGLPDQIYFTLMVLPVNLLLIVAFSPRLPSRHHPLNLLSLSLLSFLSLRLLQLLKIIPILSSSPAQSP